MRWTLDALLVASTALFAVGVNAERSESDAESATAQAEVTGAEAAGEPEGAHEETAKPGQAEGGDALRAGGETHADEDETLLGVDLESTPLIVLAVLAGLGLAGLAATRFGRRRGLLHALAVIALAWAALDVGEAIDQIDESRTGVAIVAIAVAVLHLAVAAISGRLARQAPAAT